MSVTDCRLMSALGTHVFVGTNTYDTAVLMADVEAHVFVCGFDFALREVTGTGPERTVIEMYDPSKYELCRICPLPGFGYIPVRDKCRRCNKHMKIRKYENTVVAGFLPCIPVLAGRRTNKCVNFRGGQKFMPIRLVGKD